MKLFRKRSFTLVETLSAVVLLTISAILFFYILSTSVGYLKRIIELRTAALILQERISLIRNLRFSEVDLLPGTFSSSYMASLEGATGIISRSEYDGRDDIIEITLTLDWTSYNDKVSSRTITTLITNHGIDKR
jgi:type II secretory pathway pseudopilin PulG